MFHRLLAAIAAIAAIAAVALVAVAPASAQDPAAVAAITPAVAKAGRLLKDSAGGRIGKIDQVLGDGSVRVIFDERFVVIPAATLSIVDGEAVTSLAKRDVAKLR